MMPQSRSNSSLRVAQVGSVPIRAPRPETPPPNPNRPPQPWVLLVAVLALAALATAVAVWVRRGPLRAWKSFAAAAGAEFRSDDGLSPRVVSGEIRSRPFLLETATSHEDEAGYYHTRARLPIKNIGSFILGLRRKSLLELAQTRGDSALYSLGDPDFERQFFIYCNDPENLAAILTGEARRELMRYHDVEIYVRMGEMEWRRAGEQGDLAAIRRLTDLLVDMAQAIDDLPARGRSLTQVLADEKMIEKGV